MDQAFSVMAHTGFPGLDEALLHVRLGDNVVFQIDSISVYRHLARRYIESAWRDGYPVVYFRFARHENLIEGQQPEHGCSRIRRTPLISRHVGDVDADAEDFVIPAPEAVDSSFDALTPSQAQSAASEPAQRESDCLPSLTIVNLNPEEPFESFVRTIYQTATEFGLRTFYLFDCLSDLLVGWASDLMIGNFFQIVCPYLFKLETVAYFSLFRCQHTDDTINRIRVTTQLLLNVYESDNQIFIHPLKVWNRHTSTMFLPHRLTDKTCTPLTSSSDVTSLYLRLGVDAIAREVQKDYWDLLFDEARTVALQLLDSTETTQGDAQAEEIANISSRSVRNRLQELLFGKRTQMSHLIDRYLALPDLVGIHRRMIGSGQVGGKAAGLLVARKILEQAGPAPLIDRLEPHDSFYLGSDLYYTYIVYNGWWHHYVNQKTERGYYTEAAKLRTLMLQGEFPEKFRHQFQQLLDYFGQAPIIVRSSSLLEDDYGHAFAGKYESVFCVNQGDPDQRYQAFVQAIRQVYASTMDESALAYRQDMGLSEHDELMALLVQRVSGDEHGDQFYPTLAGVGYSKNIYIWHSDLDPDAGVIRLVYGLGTRAVDRSDGDYTRLVSLDHPFLTPNHDAEDERKYAQKLVDLLNLKQNCIDTLPLSQLVNSPTPPDLRLFGEPDHEGNRMLKSLGIRNKDSWILNFKRILNEQSFIDDMQSILKTLSRAYDYPVDIEFTINFQPDQLYRINLLQCRPLQVKGNLVQFDIPEYIDYNNEIIRSNGEFMGGNIHYRIDYVIYIIAETYDKLALQDRYQVARTIGQLNRALAREADTRTLLIGPGRWGTTTPSLGIPVRFSEINRMTALAEYAFESAGMRPELSYGSHFFQDLVEADIFYFSIDCAKPEIKLDDQVFLSQENRLQQLLPDAANLASIIHVGTYQEKELILHSDVRTAGLVLYFNESGRSDS